MARSGGAGPWRGVGAGLLLSCGQRYGNQAGLGDSPGQPLREASHPRPGGLREGGLAEPRERAARWELWPWEEVATESRGWAGQVPGPWALSSLLLSSSFLLVPEFA